MIKNTQTLESNTPNGVQGKARAIRGAVLTFTQDPFLHEQDYWHYDEDGIVVMENGVITQIGSAQKLLPTLGDIPLTTYSHGLILPGFIDAHVHYAQIPMIAALGYQLIDWLNKYTFKVEQNFIDADFSRGVAQIFLRESIKHGVTSSVVYGTVYPQSIDVLFEEAAKMNLRLMAGKVCMDRHAPESLLDTAQLAYDDSKALIEKWHGRGRAEYVITPRFAPSSTPEQMSALGGLAVEYPKMLIQSHISENMNEIAWVKELFPQSKDYADVYDQFGLIRPRAIYGHGIHLNERECQLFHDKGAAIAHCPTSNFFLGSGSLNMQKMKQANRPVHIALATDLGAGTSFSMLQTMSEAYKAAQTHQLAYDAAHFFYLATLGSARALGLENKIGRIAVGYEADLVVLDTEGTDLLKFRTKFAESLPELLSILLTLGDDRAIAETYVAGEPLKTIQAEESFTS